MASSSSSRNRSRAGTGQPYATPPQPQLQQAQQPDSPAPPAARPSCRSCQAVLALIASISTSIRPPSPGGLAAAAAVGLKAEARAAAPSHQCWEARLRRATPPQRAAAAA